jgi:hypothetical protein
MVVMAKPPKKPKPEEVETHPDAWDRFQKTMDKIVPPKHRSAGKSGATKTPNKR